MIRYHLQHLQKHSIVKQVHTRWFSAGKRIRSIEQLYQKKTPIEHILLRPDTYVGTTEQITEPMWVYDKKHEKMVHRTITYVPGLYKIFDEILVNAADQKQRDPSMTTIRVNIDPNEGKLSIWNDGKGIPVIKHQEHNVYVPELLFGHLLTGSNFNDDVRKTTGGRNGYGAKLTNIFSKEFTIETASKVDGLKYTQVFRNNMGIKEEPELCPWSDSDYTCVAFKPDLERFHMKELDKDTLDLFSKRVYDIAGVCANGLDVYLNDKKLNVSDFTEYVNLYGKDENIVFEKSSDRWQVGVGVSDDGFKQVSFVNSISTSKGGQHVNYIQDQIVRRLMEIVKKKTKSDDIKASYINNHLSLYVTAMIENPAFDSQTKETLTTRPSGFGSQYELSNNFFKRVEKSGVIQRILSFAKYKQHAELRRKGGTKQRKLSGIPKLDDANFAGTVKGGMCTLILTEGDSAKALAMSGLSVVGRDCYGVFPLKGKLLNVRDASHAQIMKNEEIQNIVRILGLKYGQEYQDTESLRYGHLMVMADQDHDGSHIKGLVINFLHHFWPSLLKIDGFLKSFATPIVKASKGSVSESFYSLTEYQQWKEQLESERGWKIKYYKGLGTSSAKEAKEYFTNLDAHKADFCWTEDEDGDAIDMAFSKQRVEARKEWLQQYVPGNSLDFDDESVSLSDFVNKELIQYSVADNVRSIPSVVDGLKPSQRKVLFGCFKRNLKDEIKVAQLAGYISEQAAYHHGEMSLNGTIVNMAQDFPGSNNINLLKPNGQFGTRFLGGKDAASPRYIFTQLEAIARCIFNPLDDPLLTYLDDDGQSIEPKWYLPIIPLVLANGGEGIGTGWSTAIPNYCPREIIANLRRKLNGEALVPLTPSYRGFAGEIAPKEEGKDRNFVAKGKFEVINTRTIKITELPIKVWTQNYKQFLEKLAADGHIKDFKENHTDTSICFQVKMDPEKLKKLEHTSGGIEKKFRLSANLPTSNMNMFDQDGVLQKYTDAEHVLEAFFPLRLEYYYKRKEFMLRDLEAKKMVLENKTKFIQAVLSREIDLNDRSRDELLCDLQERGFEPLSRNSEKETELSRGYDYLLSMRIWNLTKEQVLKLEEEFQQKTREYENLGNTTPEAMWLADLDELEHLIMADEEIRALNTPQAKTKKTRRRRKTTS